LNLSPEEPPEIGHLHLYLAAADMVGGGDDLVLLHALDQAGGAIVADLKVALHEAGRRLALAADQGHRLVMGALCVKHDLSAVRQRQCDRAGMELGEVVFGVLLLARPEARLARGALVLVVPHGLVEQAVAGIHAFVAENGLPPVGLTERSFKEWEAGHTPSADYAELLARFFRTRPIQLAIPLGFLSVVRRYFVYAAWPALKPVPPEFQE